MRDAQASDRVREAYERQSHRWEDLKYRSWMPGNILIDQEADRTFVDLLRRHGMLPLDERRVLDVGCGEGKKLIRMHGLGACLDDLAGIDIVEGNIESARRRAPGVDFRVADAVDLPFADGEFDLAMAFMPFSSMPDDATRRQAAAEIMRVLRRDGALVWYDFRVNPRNPDVTALGIADVRGLFPDCTIDARRVTLAPPIARRLAPISWLACELLGQIPLLRTHWLALIRPAEPA